MARSYSLDLREKIAGYVDRGHSRRAAARVFAVSPSFVVKLLDRRRRTGSLAASARGGGRKKLAPYRQFLLAAVAAEPDQTMPELAAKLVQAHGVVVAPASLARFLIRNGMTRKKRRSWPANKTARTSPPSASAGARGGSRSCAPRRDG